MVLILEGHFIFPYTNHIIQTWRYIQKRYVFEMALGGQLWANVFVFSQAKTLRILLTPCCENWTRKLGRGHGKKNWTKKIQAWENTKQFRCFYIDVCVFDFGKSFHGDPHGSFLSYPCHLCFGGIVFCHCCSMYVIFVRYICNESPEGRDSIGFILVRLWIHKFDRVLWAYLTVEWEVIGPVVNS